MTLADLIGGFIFSAIGFVAFVYGKRMAAYRTMGIGLVMLVYPYFVSGSTALMYGIGGALTVALFVFRE